MREQERVRRTWLVVEAALCHFIGYLMYLGKRQRQVWKVSRGSDSKPSIAIMTGQRLQWYHTGIDIDLQRQICINKLEPKCP
jgi:hypothetical protein